MLLFKVFNYYIWKKNLNTMEALRSIERQISKLYSEFFKENGINSIDGIWTNAPNERKLRFASMPHIGEKYCSAKIKIMFVGLDIGADEKSRIQTFEERRGFSQSCDNFFSKNAHISGTYIETLCLLKNQYQKEWHEVYNIKDKQNRTVLRSLSNILPTDLLQYITLTNYYKFVTIERINRKGQSDRDHFGLPLAIKKLFLDEVEILKPDIIWFQGNDFRCYQAYNELLNKNDRKIIVAYHPSSYLKLNINGDVVVTNTPYYTDLVVRNSYNG